MGYCHIRKAIEGLKCETAVHICYGYGIKANTDWKKTLGSEWRQYEESFPKLAKSNIDMVSLSVTTHMCPSNLFRFLKAKK